VAILAVGTMVLPSIAAAELLERDDLHITVVNCRFLKPYDEVTLAVVLARHQHVLIVEEGAVVNGFGAYMAAIIAAHDPSIRVQTLGVPDRIIPAAPRPKQLASVGLTPDGIANKVRALLETEVLAG
jgi:1-deoxy-D-xylulose-5-phosphate synthase